MVANYRQNGKRTEKEKTAPSDAVAALKNTLMPEPTAGIGIAEKLLSTLRSVPTWLFLGSAAACAVLLFSPDVASLHFTEIRKQWGPQVALFGTVALSLAVFRIGEASLKGAVAYRRQKHSKRVLKFWPGPSQTSMWGVTQQPDGRFTSQVSVSLSVFNTAPQPVCIARVEIAKPKMSDLIQSCLFFPSHDREDYATLDAYETATAQIHILANGRLSESESPIRITVVIIDHLGTRYLIKDILCTPIPKPARKQ